MQSFIAAALQEAQQGLTQLLANKDTQDKIAQAATMLVQCFKKQGHVYSFGNGGSMCDAMHFAEELSGRFRRDRAALGAMAASDPAHLTCAANDFGFDQVFARFVAAHGRSGDVILAISTSGKSPNCLAAVEEAKRLGIKVITLTGKPQSVLGQKADIDICTPAGQFSDRVQELHIKVIHILIELVEREMFPANYH